MRKVIEHDEAQEAKMPPIFKDLLSKRHEACDQISTCRRCWS